VSRTIGLQLGVVLTEVYLLVDESRRYLSPLESVCFRSGTDVSVAVRCAKLNVMSLGSFRIAWLWIGSSAVGLLIGEVLAFNLFPPPPFDPSAMQGITNQHDWIEAGRAFGVSIPFAISQWLVLRHVLAIYGVPHKRLSILWIPVTSVALASSLFFVPTGAAMFFLLPAIKPMLPGMLVLGLVQWMVLYRLINARVTWAIITFAGGSVAVFMGPIAGAVAGSAAQALVFGGSIGCLQAFVLTAEFNRNSRRRGSPAINRKRLPETIVAIGLAVVAIGAIAPSLLAMQQYRSVNSVAYSPDGTRIAADVENYLYVWDAETGQLIFGISSVQDPVASWSAERELTFSPDGSRIAVASQGLGAIIVHSETGERLLVIDPGRFPHVEDIAFSPDGMRVGLVLIDEKVAIYDAIDGRLLINLKSSIKKDIETPMIRTVAFSPDNKKVAAGGSYWPRRGPFEGFAAVWDVVTQQELFVLTGHDGVVWTLVFSLDNQYIMTQSPESVRVWDASDGSALLTLGLKCSLIAGAVLMPDGDHIMTGCMDGNLYICEIANGECRLAILPRFSGLDSLDVHPDGIRVVLADRGGLVETWNSQTGKKIRKFKMPRLK